MNKLILSLLLIVLANIGTWFQFQGHFWSDKPIWKSPYFIMSVGGILSMAFWHATRLSYEHFGQFWNIRLMGFGVGTVICLMLAAAIVMIQITNVIE
jgi:hypothetical protein